MACHVIPFICLCLGTILVQGMQLGPRHEARPIPDQELPRSTILSAMTLELTSIFGSCSFPPNDVLTNADSFDFLARCDIRTPHVDMLITDEGVIRCLGLLEIGLRLCSLEAKYFKNGALNAVPKDSHDFNSLLDVVNNQSDPNLCADLKKVLDVLGENEFPVINRWNLNKIFHESDESCTRICFDFNNKPRIMCKLILWGSKLLIQTEPKPFGANITNSPLAYQPSIPYLGLGQDQTNKKITTPSTLNPDLSAPREGDELRESQENMLVSSKNEDTETGIRLVGSSSTPTSLVANQANDADEGLVEQPIAISKSSVDRPLETSSKSDGKKNVGSPKTKSIGLPTLENQAPDVIGSEENAKNIGGLAGSSTSKHKTGLDILDGDTRKGMTNPTSLTDTLKPKDVAVGMEENSVVSPVDKPLSDIDARGDEFPEHYDASLDPSQDDDDDVNFPVSVDQEQPAINQEPTGYKTDYKSPREEFANGNTVLQERFVDSEDSHFFSYFIAMVVLCIVGYVVFHNKQKILALALEGRSKRGSRRRPVSSANYHKLDNNLEEAVSSPCSASVTHVIY